MTGNKKSNRLKRHPKWSVAIVIIVILVIIGSIGGNNTTNQTSTKTTSNTSTSSSSKSAPASTTAMPKINQQANDGKLGFTITSFKCGVSEISQPDNTDYTDSTGAPYCLMNVSVKGVSTVSQNFDSSSQYVLDSGGKQYSVDSDATITANASSSTCMEYPTVNPGVTLTCTLAFDIPSSATPSVAVLHDSSASDGVKVSLK